MNKKLSYLLFPKAAFCGLVLLFVSNSLSAQNDTLENYLERELEQVLDRFFFTDHDNLIQHSKPLAELAHDHRLWHQYLNITLQKAYASEYHGKIDLYFEYLNEGVKIIDRYEGELDSLDADGKFRAELYYAQGYGHYLTGDMSRAIEAYQLAETKAFSGEDSLLLFDTSSQLGLCHFNQLDFENAILNYERAQQWLPLEASNYGEVGYQHLQAYIERAKGRNYYAKGRLADTDHDKVKALSLYHSALKRLLPLEKKSAANLKSKVYTQLAQYYLDEEYMDSAQYYANKILPASVSTEVEQIANYLFVGRVHLINGNDQKARQHFEHASFSASSNFKKIHYSKARAFAHLGLWHVHQYQWKDALAYYQKSLEQLTSDFTAQEDVYRNPDLAAITLDKEFLEVMLLKADALYQWHQSNHDQQTLLASIDCYQLALATVDRMRQGFLLPESREFLSAKSVSIYERSLEACYQAYSLGLGKAYQEMAFQIMEQNKSNLLLEAVQDVAAKSYAGVNKDLIEKEQTFKSKIAYLKRQLALQKQEDQVKANQWQQEIFVAQQSYQQLMTQLESDYPEYFQLKYQVASVSVGGVQDKLIKLDQALIEYFYGDSSLFVVGISKDKVVFEKVVLSKDIKQVLASYIKHHQQYFFGTDPSAQSSFTDDGYILYQQLLDPVLNLLGPEIRSLQIIPDGLLGYLPFDILLTHPTSEEGFAYKSLSYLIKNYTISTEFSATLWQKADVHQEKRSFPYLGFAPSFEGPAGVPGRLVVRGGGKDLLVPLRFNQREVIEAQKLFGGKAFLGPEATEAEFKQYAPQTKILHLSTHAFARDQQVQYSGLVFYQSADSSDEGNDGYMYLDELYNLQLSSELAVLSACQTATGALVRGEGIMSLGRAFKYAGCPNIVMSLWSVPDQSTSQIMKYFYQELKAGQGKAEALRTAKLRYLEQADANTADPYYWAAFTLIGDDLPVIAKGNKTLRTLLVVFGLIILAIISFWARQKFKIGRDTL